MAEQPTDQFDAGAGDGGNLLQLQQQLGASGAGGVDPSKLLDVQKQLDAGAGDAGKLLEMQQLLLPQTQNMQTAASLLAAEKEVTSSLLMKIDG